MAMSGKFQSLTLLAGRAVADATIVSDENTGRADEVAPDSNRRLSRARCCRRRIPLDDCGVCRDNTNNGGENECSEGAHSHKVCLTCVVGSKGCFQSLCLELLTEGLRKSNLIYIRSTKDRV